LILTDVFYSKMISG